MKQKVVIVAGGVGKRMHAKIPKQFMKIGGEVILMRTMRIFNAFDNEMEIIVTLPEQEIKTWEQLCGTYKFRIPHRVVAGGNTRFNSVKNALETIDEDSLVAIHDAVRPLVSAKTIKRVFDKAGEKGNAIPVLSANESLRYITGTENKSVVRDHYKMVQTPQVFHNQLLIYAYQQEYRPEFTDDASVVESKGILIETVEGNSENIKITTKKDLDIAEVLLSYLNSE